MSNEKNIDLLSSWEKTLSDLEVTLNRPIYETILSSTRPISVEDGVFLLAVPTLFSQDYLYEKKCDSIILNSINNFITDKIRSVKFVVIPKEDAEEEEEREKKIVAVSTPPISMPFLNPRYTFDNFVVGNGSRFAHAAALAVSESPGKAYNPLFIYGGVGLGKTHLMQAIAFNVYKANPKAKIVYITSEKFTNEVIDSIRYDKMTAFRNKYRSVDVLMVDDIQFIAGKERTQEEFFHTFNALYESSKQIIISNDRPPKEVNDIDERLRSRFEWGLIADIQPPDYETRVAILKKKAELEEIVVPDDVYNLIASRVTSNIRELEGALLKLFAHSAIDNKDITLAVAEEKLKDIMSPTKGKPPVTIELIKKITAEYYSLKIDDMSAKTRTKEIATARQIAMYLSRELTSASLPKIGDSFGGRDHSTVIHGYEKIKSCMNDDKEIADAVTAIAERIKKIGSV